MRRKHARHDALDILDVHKFHFYTLARQPSCQQRLPSPNKNPSPCTRVMPCCGCVQPSLCVRLCREHQYTHAMCDTALLGGGGVPRGVAATHTHTHTSTHKNTHSISLGTPLGDTSCRPHDNKIKTTRYKRPMRDAGMRRRLTLIQIQLGGVLSHDVGIAVRQRQHDYI